MAVSQAVQRPANYDRFRSWLAVLGATLSLFCTVGFLNAFGVFQEFYHTYIPGKSDSDISWIGSISIFMMYAGSPVAGIFVDKLGPTILLCVGSVVLLFALFMTSLCTQYYQFFLAQGLLVGMGMSLIFCPPLAVVSRRLAHRRGLAMGITIGGSSIGGVIWPIMLNRLLNYDGNSFGWTIRIVAFIMIPLLAIACLTVADVQAHPSARPEATLDHHGTEDTKTPVVSEKPKADYSIIRKPPFFFLAGGLVLSYLGLFTPLFYVSSYAVSQGRSFSTGIYILSALNAASFFGRVIPGHLADSYGHFNLEILSILLAGIIGFCWTAATSLGGLIVWSMAYGFASGAVMALQNPCVGKIASHHSQGKAVGFLTGFISIAALIGTPISGQLLTHFGYVPLSMWTGATLVAGSAVVATARLQANRSTLFF